MQNSQNLSQSQGPELCAWYATFWIYKEKSKNC